MPRPSFGLTRAAAVAVLVIVVPIVLVRLGGDAVPRLSTDLLREWVHQPLTPGFLAMVVLAGGWLMWALLATAVAVRLYTAIARLTRWLPPIHLPRPLQGLTAAILGASAITATTTGNAHATPTPTTATAHDPARDATSAATDTTTSDRTADDGNPTHTVRRGESLSTIAKHRLGDHDRWNEIFALNRGTRFPTGGTLTKPDIIHPGWVLDLPANTVTPSNGEKNRPDSPQRPVDATPEPGSPTLAPTTVPPRADPAAGITPHDSSVSPEQPSAAPAPTAVCDTNLTGDSDTERQRPARGVSLPGGSWVDLGLAVAIAAAVTLIWAHRRHRYVPGTPSPASRLADPELTPMPRVVRQIRQGLRGAVPPDTAGHDTRDSGDEEVANHDAPDGYGSGADDHASGGPSSAATCEEDTPDAVTTVPSKPALAHPLSTVCQPRGMGLTGPGAQAAARGFLIAALAADHTEHPDARTHVVMPSTTAATLLGDAVTLPRTPRLTVTASLAAALQVLETQVMHRIRLVDQHEVDTVAALRRTGHCGEPLPPILLIADDAASHERTRIAATLNQGEHLDIHGVLLAPWPDGATVVVDTDGTTTPADQSRHPDTPFADLGRLTVLTPADTIDLITTLTEAHTGQRPAPVPTTKSTDTGSTQDPQPAPTDTTTADADAPEQVRHLEVGKAVPKPTIAVAARTTPDPSTGSRRDTAEVPDNDAHEDRSPQPDGRVAVRVLGDARIIDMDTTMPLRAKSLELLVYLVVHDGDATQDGILDDLLPDAPRSKAPHRLHTYVSALRKTLARTGGTASYLTHPQRRYALNREALDVDLWRMRDALHDAERATNDLDRVAALRAAVDAYGGGLADGFDYEWIEAHREGIRRQALDAHLALAIATTDPAEALTVLEAAIRHDPYAEPLYQQAMRTRATLGHLDEIRTLRRTLTRRLDEIDAEPSEDTIALADRLIADLRRRHPAGQPDPRGGQP